ncbi:MAG: thiamine phosphate synthase [Gemmatimonadaceae bacterium]|nr:thiamine phosphate synthase [Gemmatimonadaceae bacterium]
MMDPRIVRLIAITDNVRDGQNGLITRAAAAVRGGATCIQLRLKDVAPRDLVGLARELVKSVGAPVIINDRADVAIAAGAAGVHLGADDVPVRAVRAFAPPGFIVGASVGCDKEVPNAVGADYVGIGPVFGTGSKSDAGKTIGVEEFARLAALVGLPAVAIGGVDAANARLVMDAGAAGVAAIAAVFGVSDPMLAAQELITVIGGCDTEIGG